jgi:hypothetical protein
MGPTPPIERTVTVPQLRRRYDRRRQWIRWVMDLVPRADWEFRDWAAAPSLTPAEEAAHERRWRQWVIRLDMSLILMGGWLLLTMIYSPR